MTGRAGAPTTVLICLRCGAPRARGTRHPALYCGSACRKAAHRERGAWMRGYEARHRQKASRDMVAAIAVTRALKLRRDATVKQLQEAVASWHAALSTRALRKLLKGLVEDGVLESVAGAYAMVPDFIEEQNKRAARRRDVSQSPERGSEVARSHRRDRDAFVTVRSGRRAPKGAECPRHRAPEGAVPSVAPPATSSGPPRARSCAPAPSAARNIANIAPPQPDGGTSFRCRSDVANWSRRLARLLTLRATDLPSEVVLTCSDGTTVHAVVKSGGRGSRRVKLLFVGEAQLDLHPNGDVYLEADAQALWSQGTKTWLTTWLDRASLWFLGNSCPSLARARDLGWTTWKLELAADFVGLDIHLEDLGHFVGRSAPALVGSRGFQDGAVETVSCSRRRRHGLSVSTHNKTQRLVNVDKVQPEQSVYYATWRAHGYDGASRVRRVEVRASGAALCLRPSKRRRKQDSASGTLDLRDPAALLDPVALGRFWRHGTTKYRLTSESNNEKVRVRPTDPRWQAVQAAGGASEGVEYAVVDREGARRLSIDYLLAKEERKLARAQVAVHQLRERQRALRQCTEGE